MPVVASSGTGLQGARFKGCIEMDARPSPGKRRTVQEALGAVEAAVSSTKESALRPSTEEDVALLLDTLATLRLHPGAVRELLTSLAVTEALAQQLEAPSAVGGAPAPGVKRPGSALAAPAHWSPIPNRARAPSPAVRNTSLESSALVAATQSPGGRLPAAAAPLVDSVTASDAARLRSLRRAADFEDLLSLTPDLVPRAGEALRVCGFERVGTCVESAGSVLPLQYRAMQRGARAAVAAGNESNRQLKEAQEKLYMITHGAGIAGPPANSWLAEVPPLRVKMDPDAEWYMASAGAHTVGAGASRYCVGHARTPSMSCNMVLRDAVVHGLGLGGPLNSASSLGGSRDWSKLPAPAGVLGGTAAAVPSRFANKVQQKPASMGGSTTPFAAAAAAAVVTGTDAADAEASVRLKTTGAASQQGLAAMGSLSMGAGKTGAPGTALKAAASHIAEVSRGLRM